MLKVNNLVFDYPSGRILHGVSFEAEPGSVIGLVGPNGAGKTTLMRCIASIEEPYLGKLEFGDIDLISEPLKAHRITGFLQDSFGLFEDLTGRQSFTYFAAAQAVSPDLWDERIAEIIDLLEMDKFIDKPIGELSLGQRQRVAIGQSILHKPKLLLLDEPATGLDPKARKILSRTLRRLRDEGMTLVVSSHILSELEDYSTHMLILRDGRCVDFMPIDHAIEHQKVLKRLNIKFLTGIEKAREILEQHDLVSSLDITAREIRLDFSGTEHEQASLLQALIAKGCEILAFSTERRNLQDVYLEWVEPTAAPPQDAKIETPKMENAE